MWKLFTAIFFLALPAFSGGVIVGGNGGDPIPVQFLHGKIWAHKISMNFDANFFPQHFPDQNNKVKAWIEKNHLALAANIMASDHQGELVGRVDGRCAWTNVGDNPETVHYFIPDCENKIITLDDAIQLLIHEAVHHFPDSANPTGKIVDETFCDSVALALYLTYHNQINSERPRWDDTNASESPLGRAHHSAIWTGFTDNNSTQYSMIVWGGCKEARFGALCSENSYLNDVALYQSENLNEGTWFKKFSSNAPTPRAFHTAVWTGHTENKSTELKMLVWGGCTGKNCWQPLSDGHVYDPLKNDWHPISNNNSPQGRINHVGLWLEDKLFIWGGEIFGSQPVELADGGIYDIAKDRWKIVSNKNAPAARKFHTAVWTGDKGPSAQKVIVWGGCSDTQLAASCKTPFNDGAIYDLESDTWEKMPENNILSPRYKHTAVWTGEEMIIWGGAGQTPSQYFSDGAVFNLATKTWRPLRGNGPSARAGHSAVWTEQKMLIYAGMRKVNGVTQLPDDVGELTLQKNGNANWTLQSSPNLQRIYHSSIWTGQSLFIWGGKGEGTDFINSGVAFYPKLETN